MYTSQACTTLITVCILAVLLFFSAFILVPHRDAKTIHPNDSTIATTPTKLVETYIAAHLSALSPIKEQLGGTFYVTAFEAHDDTGVVQYEDGHNAYIADFTYIIDEMGRVTIPSFVIRQ